MSETTATHVTGSSGGQPKRSRSPLQRGSMVRLVEIAYVALAGFLVAQLAKTILTPLSGPAPITHADQARSIPDLTVFTRFDPFIGSMPAEEAAQPSQVAETRLNLRLVGTFVEDGRATAIIQNDNGEQRAYSLDEEIARGVSLEEVRADYVLLLRNGVRETLSLEGRERRQPERSAAQTPQPAASSDDRQTVPTGALSRFVTVERTGDGQFVLFAGPNPQLFDAAGLLNGDVLVAVNGQRLTAATGGQTLSTLGRSFQRGPTTITVERGGVTLEKSFDPSGLAP